MADQLATMFYANGRNREAPALYTLRDWAWDLDRTARAHWAKKFRPFVGHNPSLERVTDGR